MKLSEILEGDKSTRRLIKIMRRRASKHNPKPESTNRLNNFQNDGIVGYPSPGSPGDFASTTWGK